MQATLASRACSPSGSELALAAIAAGSATRKSEGPEGVEPVLSPAHGRRIESLLAVVPPPVALAIEADLARIAGAGAPSVARST